MQHKIDSKLKQKCRFFDWKPTKPTRISPVRLASTKLVVGTISKALSPK